MTLYFDTKAQFLDSDAVSTVCCWHQQQPLFAVASYHLSRGACITLFDDTVSKSDFYAFDENFSHNRRGHLLMAFHLIPCIGRAIARCHFSRARGVAVDSVVLAPRAPAIGGRLGEWRAECMVCRTTDIRVDRWSA